MQDLSLRDKLLLAQMPIVPLPVETEVDRLDRNGQRLLIAANGIFIEIRRDWLYAVRLCGELDPLLQRPFGSLAETTELAGGRVPRRLVDEFVQLAREASPLEVGAIITYDSASGKWALRANHSVSSSAVRLRYEIPDLLPTEHRVVDIHSHGEGPAFLSATDIADTRGTTAVVMVVGRVSEPTPEVVAYLYLHGMPIELSLSPGGDIDVAC